MTVCMISINFMQETIPDIFIGKGTLGQNQVVFDMRKLGDYSRRIDLN